jgi:His-Xaa-Ser system radical SAM maturase HxsC
VVIALSGRVRNRATNGPLRRRVWRLAAAGRESGHPGEATLVSAETNAARTTSLLVVKSGGWSAGRGSVPAIELPPELDYLDHGDVISASPDGARVRVLYRARGRQNSILLTERCDNYCVMCSQPPKDRRDDQLLEDAKAMVPLLPDPAQGLCFTGGEPTLYGKRFIDLLELCAEHVPRTEIHILSNGRRFAERTFSEAYAAAGHKGIMVGIPLYGPEAGTHDYVVQSRGAFAETMLGILRLGELKQRLEIRVVLQASTVAVLEELAEFIARNLPFVEQVALMGLEMMGFARANADVIWADPHEYRDTLRDAVLILDSAGVKTLVYNHQLCVLHRDVWPFAVRSISDWKNEYFEECRGCAARAACGGFFSSASFRRSSGIRALAEEEVEGVAGAVMERS